MCHDKADVTAPAAFIAAGLLVISARPSDAQTADLETGSLCVLPHVKPADAPMQSPDVPPAADTYSLRMDGGEWVPLSPERRARM